MIDDTQLILLVAALLFSIGIAVIVVKRNTVMILFGIELMLNAANINLVVFNRIHAHNEDGQMFALFVIIVAVCEADVGLAIVLQIYRRFQSSNPEEIMQLKD